MCSYAFRPLLFGRSAKETALVAEDVVDDRGRDDGDVGDVEFDVCDRLTFFVGGCSVSVATVVLMEGR